MSDATSRIGRSFETVASSMPTPTEDATHAAASRRSARLPVVGSEGSRFSISGNGTVNLTTLSGIGSRALSPLSAGLMI